MAAKMCLLDMTGKQCHELQQGQNSIGRGDDCTIQIDHPLLSRLHAILGVADGFVTVTDLESTNGTLVNFKKIKSGQVLRVGDAVTFAELTFRLGVVGADLRETVLRAPREMQVESYCISDMGDGHTALRERISLPKNWNAADEVAFPNRALPISERRIQSVLDAAKLNLEAAVAVLVVLTPGVPSQILALKGVGQFVWSLGRGDHNDVILEHETVSLKHALITYTNNVWMIQDQQSRNGLKLNGAMVSVAVLEHNATIKLGEVEMVFRDL